jgi:hypothetical protein
MGGTPNLIENIVLDKLWNICLKMRILQLFIQSGTKKCEFTI